MESWHSTALDFHLLCAVSSKARYILRQDIYNHMICGLPEVLTFPEKNLYCLLTYWFLVTKYTTSLVNYTVSCFSPCKNTSLSFLNLTHPITHISCGFNSKGRMQSVLSNIFLKRRWTGVLWCISKLTRCPSHSGPPAWSEAWTAKRRVGQEKSTSKVTRPMRNKMAATVTWSTAVWKKVQAGRWCCTGPLLLSSHPWGTTQDSRNSDPECWLSIPTTSDL